MSGNFDELDQFEQEQQEPKPHKKYYGKGFYTVGGTGILEKSQHMRVHGKTAYSIRRFF